MRIVVTLLSALAVQLGAQAALRAQEPPPAPPPLDVEDHEPGAAPPLPPDPLPAALDEARALVQQGEARAAATLLRAMHVRFPQDYALALELAWLEFSSGQYAAAERSYRAAAALSGGSRDARLGLGWTLVRLGRCDEARVELEAARALDPSDSRAAEGLAACAPVVPAIDAAPAVALFPSVSVTGIDYVGHDSKSLALSTAAGLSGLFWSRGLVGALARVTHVPFKESGGQGQGGRSGSFQQVELWLGLGVTTEPLGVVAQYGLVSDGSGFTGTSHSFGGSVRVSPLGDVIVEGGVTTYDAATYGGPDLVGGVATRWRLPLVGPLYVVPGLRLGFFEGEVLPSASTLVGVDTDVVDAYVGGVLGRERRPVHWAAPLLLNLPETIAEGAWAGVALELGDRWQLGLDYTLRRLHDEDSLDDTGMHTLTLSAARVL